ncbi:TNT domain-containing protein [Halopolyspora algeriensis]|uniref:TNT domain-containing protein n=1 Tax=Halopolyspora algeriensis TaxID=1500506 RepID=UPI000DF1D1A6|nr:TNT domain-containing protein [Halopolyspora algeriensis]
MLHQFPLGYMPVAASRPSRQWSPPEAGGDRGVRDHPRAELIADTGALARARAGVGGADAARRNSPAAGNRQVPEDLVTGYDPLGELGEIEWERTYVARAGSPGTDREYVWPASAGLPEGGVEPAEAIVLEPGTVVDRLGGEAGRILAAAGTAFARRCLPPEYRKRAYGRYRVLRSLPVWRTSTAAWFAQPGGGSRYRVTHPVVELMAMGYLAELPGDGDACGDGRPETSTVRIDVGRGGAVEPEREPRDVPVHAKQEVP